MSKTIGTVCVMLERKNDFSSCKVIKDRTHETSLKDLKKVVEIRVRDFMLRRREGPKYDKGSLRKIKMK